MRFALLVLNCFLLAGCDRGPAQGTVKGTVTLDGQPVENGMIRFVPTDGGTQPADSPVVSGVYSVTIVPGEKKVEVTWGKSRSGAKASDTASQGSDQIIEAIPFKYNSQTTLMYKVVEGEQRKHFELTTK